MRPWAALLALALLLGSWPAGQAQGAESATAPVLEDKGDDVEVQANGVPATVPQGRFASNDLRGLVLTETKTDLAFALTVASLQDTQVAVAESTSYTIDFEHNGILYLVQVYRTVLTETTYYAHLAVRDPGNSFPSTIETLPITADTATATLTMVVPRDLLVDKNGAAPFPGGSLTGFRVKASSLVDLEGQSFPLGPGGEVPLPSLSVVDRMPDTGNGTLDWAVRFGLAQTGAIRLSSFTPVRSSNGEATTFLFEVQANNSGPAQRFGLEASSVPSTWHVELPTALIEVPAASTVTFPVLVSTPFAHDHGQLQSFIVEAAGLDNAGDVGRIALGVRYTTPPQPAGHHDTMYLHSAALPTDPLFVGLSTAFGTAFGTDFGQLYFNTMTPEDDPNDAGAPVGGSVSDLQPGPPPLVTYTWHVPLSPGLQMGLDFDPTRTGTIRASIDTLLPLPGATLTGRLVHTATNGTQCGMGVPCTFEDYYFGRGTRTTAALIGPSDVAEVPAATKGHQFEAIIVATPEGDYIPFHPAPTLVLELNLTFTRVDPIFGPRDAPKLAGGEMTLPLLEYHDPVDQVFSSMEGLMIVVDGEAERLVNPGKTVLYDLGLMNHGSKDASYNLQLGGPGIEWAQILGDTRVTVRAGETRPLGIAVTAPPGTADGAFADLVLAAVDASDPSVRTLARLRTTVDVDAEHPDDASRVPGLAESLTDKESPAPTVLAGLVALAVAFVLSSRRRRQA